VWIILLSSPFTAAPSFPFYSNRFGLSFFWLWGILLAALWFKLRSLYLVGKSFCSPIDPHPSLRWSFFLMTLFTSIQPFPALCSLYKIQTCHWSHSITWHNFLLHLSPIPLVTDHIATCEISLLTLTHSSKCFTISRKPAVHNLYQHLLDPLWSFLPY
jgi:hypothetical protein